MPKCANAAELEVAARAAAEWFRDQGSVAIVVYIDDSDEWHMATPDIHGPTLARALRLLADTCEQRTEARTLN